MKYIKTLLFMFFVIHNCSGQQWDKNLIHPDSFTFKLKDYSGNKILVIQPNIFVLFKNKYKLTTKENSNFSILLRVFIDDSGEVCLKPIIINRKSLPNLEKDTMMLMEQVKYKIIPNTDNLKGDIYSFYLHFEDY